MVYYNLLEPIGWEPALVFMFFISFSHIALMNILTGLFVENAIKLAEPDRQALCLENQRSQRMLRKELLDIMHETDENGNGRICESEFQNQMEQPMGKLRAYLSSVGVHEVEALRYYE